MIVNIEVLTTYSLLLQFGDQPQLCLELIPWAVMSLQSSSSLLSEPSRIQNMMDRKMISCSSRWEQLLSAKSYKWVNFTSLKFLLCTKTTCDVKIMQTLTSMSFFFEWLCHWSPFQLNRRAQLTKAVQVISLKPGRLNGVSQCITAGWGDIGDNDTLAKRLQEVNVTTLPQNTCEMRWEPVSITGSMVCGVGARSLQGFCSVRH